MSTARPSLPSGLAPSPGGCHATGPGKPGQPSNHGPRLLPVLARIEPEHVEELRALSERTRVPQAAYLREAVDDLLRKYRREREIEEFAP